jgi:uncharacterized protein with von Willebrand factor type A (vWA) domain
MTLLAKNKTCLLLLVLFNISLVFQNTCKAETPNDTHSILFLIDISGSMKGAKECHQAYN